MQVDSGPADEVEPDRDRETPVTRETTGGPFKKERSQQQQQQPQVSIRHYLWYFFFGLSRCLCLLQNYVLRFL